MMITGWTRVVPGAALLRGGFLWASLLGVGFLAGCGDFWQAPSSTTTTTPTGASSGVFYVLNQQTAQIAGYSVVSGTLTPVSGSPYTLPGSAEPLAIAIAPNGTFLYVSTALDVIYLYTTGSGGALTLGNSSSAISADLATSMQVDATNQWLVEGGPNQAILHAIAISSSTGLATSKTEQTVPLPATTIHQLTISPDNTHIFVALGASGTEEAVFAAGNATPFGNTANIPVVNAAGAAVSVAVDPQNRLIYVGETAATSGTNSGGLRAFNYNTLAEVTGSPYATAGLAPYAILPEAKGNYVYVANRTVSGSSSGNIAGFSFTSTGTVYSLTALANPVATGVTPVSLAEDSLDTFLLVVDSGGDPDLEGYTMSSGALTSAITSATGTDPVQAGAIAGAP
jgi:6-phosphogluconolactonase (cycloisomerase 2 family)